MGFKRLRSVPLPVEKQMLVYATCVNFAIMPQETQERIVELCQDVGGQYADALLEAMTQKERNLDGVALKHYMASTTLYNLRGKFYMAWYGKS